jgi:hypothetical protein
MSDLFWPSLDDTLYMWTFLYSGAAIFVLCISVSRLALPAAELAKEWH